MLAECETEQSRESEHEGANEKQMTIRQNTHKLKEKLFTEMNNSIIQLIRLFIRKNVHVFIRWPQRACVPLQLFLFPRSKTTRTFAARANYLCEAQRKKSGQSNSTNKS